MPNVRTFLWRWLAVLLLLVVPAGQALAATSAELAILSTTEVAPEGGQLSDAALECCDAVSNESPLPDHTAEPQECALLAHFVLPAPVEPSGQPGMTGLQVPSPANVPLERPPSAR